MSTKHGPRNRERAECVKQLRSNAVGGTFFNVPWIAKVRSSEILEVVKHPNCWKRIRADSHFTILDDQLRMTAVWKKSRYVEP